jgi:predicted transposase/invertase (TIGR01784 family)
VAEFLALKPDQQFTYQIDLKSRLDYKNVMDYAKEEAEREGLLKGIEQGLEKGLEQGREQGERNKALKIAKNLKLSGMDIETIQKITGLSIDELEVI